MSTERIAVDRRPAGDSGTSGLARSALVQSGMAKLKAAWADPKTRTELLRQGQVAAEWAKQYRSQHAQERNGPGLMDRLNTKVSGSFGPKRPQARVERLRGALSSIAQSTPDLVDAVSPLRRELDDIAGRIPVAEALSGRARRRVLSSLNDRLDQLEASLADAILPESSA